MIFHASDWDVEPSIAVGAYELDVAAVDLVLYDDEGDGIRVGLTATEAIALAQLLVLKAREAGRVMPNPKLN